MTFSIRKAKRDDLAEIMDVEHLAIEQALNLETVQLIMDNNNYDVWVATTEDDPETVLGYCMFQDVGDAHVISRLLVYPSAWMRGIGRSLVNAVIADAEDHCNEVQFCCIVKQAAVGFPMFLQRCGFVLEREAGIVSLYTYTGESK